jgi:hypothetical protein
MTIVRSRRDFIVARDPKSKETATGQFNGRDITVPKGHLTTGGLVLLDDELATSATCHEVIVEHVPAAATDLAPGDRVIVYIGGDTTVHGAGISAFPELDGEERMVIPLGFIWARVKDGEILPRGRIVLTERDDVAFKRYSFGAAAQLHQTESTFLHGITASGDADPTNGGVRERDAITALYERVYRVGPDVTDLARGQVVCFSPSYSSTRLKRTVGGRTTHYHLVDSDEIYFEVS